MKDLRSLDKISSSVIKLGYAKKDIHIVWVMNNVEKAIAQNKNPERGRVVDQDILISTHDGVQRTMAQILNLGKRITKYMDGDIVIAFNEAEVDTTVKKSVFGGKYLAKAFYVRVKNVGSQPTSVANLGAEIRRKVNANIPKGVDW